MATQIFIGSNKILTLAFITHYSESLPTHCLSYHLIWSILVHLSISYLLLYVIYQIYIKLYPLWFQTHECQLHGHLYSWHGFWPEQFLVNTSKGKPLPTTPFLQALACVKSFTSAWLLFMKVVTSISSWFSSIKISLSQRANLFALFCKGILLSWRVMHLLCNWAFGRIILICVTMTPFWWTG